MKKIAFVVSGKSPKNLPGGLGAYAFNTAQILSEMGFAAYIIAFSDVDEVLDLGFGKLVHVATPFRKLVSLGLFLITPALARRIEAIIAEEKPEDVLIYGAGLWGRTGAMIKNRTPADRGYRLRCVTGYFSTFEHDSKGQVVGAPTADYGLIAHLEMLAVHWISKLVFRPIEHRMLKDLDRVIVHYDSTRKILLDEVRGLPAERIDKIPYYVELYSRESETSFKKEAAVTKSGMPTVGVICRQDPRKGINTFLKAVRELTVAGVEFNCLVVGSGIFLERNRRLAARLGIGHRVQFLGFVKAVEPVLESLDVYVLPSVEEGSGAISLLEAMKKGLAIVTTRCDGIPEDFVHGETGILVEMNDAGAMAKGLSLVIKDAALRKRLADNVREDYPRRFTFEKMRNGIGALLETIR